MTKDGGAPGDLCSVKGRGVRHYGICVAKDAAGRRRFIHNTPGNGVEEVTEQVFAQGKPIRVEQRPAPGDQARVIARARALVGRTYDLVSFNCEHAANLAASGEASSVQVQRAMLGLVGVVGLLLLNNNGTFVDVNGYRRGPGGQFAKRLFW